MGFVDSLKGLVGKGKEVAAQNADKIEQAVDKAGAAIKDKTGGKFDAQIDKGAEAVKHAIPTDESAPAAAPAEAAAAPAEPAPAEAPAEPAPEPAPEAPSGEQPPA